MHVLATWALEKPTCMFLNVKTCPKTFSIREGRFYYENLPQQNSVI